jgi:hypothetical protein
MPEITPQHFLNADIPHRLAVLRGFRDRCSNLHSDTAAMDGAMVTCRSLWAILGVAVDSKNKPNPSSLSLGPCTFPLPSNVQVARLDAKVRDNLDNCAIGREIVKVLVAANKCVAHLDKDADHEVDKDILDRVIDHTVGEIKARIPEFPPLHSSDRQIEFT